jgi:hypothetical protein
VLDVRRWTVSVGPLITFSRALGPNPGPTAIPQVRAQVAAVRDVIKANLLSGSPDSREDVDYLAAEDLLIHGDKATDFFILELVDHFKWYGLPMPQVAAVEVVGGSLANSVMSKRSSGHVTASFAEAMCPWVFEYLQVSSNFFRLKRLSPGAFGRRQPDFVFSAQFNDNPRNFPCEVKHFQNVESIDWNSVGIAVAQVAAGMNSLYCTDGYIFAAMGSMDAKYRYVVEVIHLAT